MREGGQERGQDKRGPRGRQERDREQGCRRVMQESEGGSLREAAHEGGAQEGRREAA